MFVTSQQNGEKTAKREQSITDFRHHLLVFWQHNKNPFWSKCGAVNTPYIFEEKKIKQHKAAA